MRSALRIATLFILVVSSSFYRSYAADFNATTLTPGVKILNIGQNQFGQLIYAAIGYVDLPITSPTLNPAMNKWGFDIEYYDFCTANADPVVSVAGVVRPTLDVPMKIVSATSSIVEEERETCRYKVRTFLQVSSPDGNAVATPMRFGYTIYLTGTTPFSGRRAPQ